MILDAEVLLIDTKTSKPLPFGTLGVHKVQCGRVVRLCVHMCALAHVYSSGLNWGVKYLCFEWSFIFADRVALKSSLSS